MSKQSPELPIIESNCVVDQRTKQLLQRVTPGQIAVIQHRDIDEVAANWLVEKKVKAIINAERSFTGQYPTKGALILLENGLPVIEISAHYYPLFQEGKHVTIFEDRIWIEGLPDDQVIIGKKLKFRETYQRYMRALEPDIYDKQLQKFIENTLYYIEKEQHEILNDQPLLDIPFRLNGRIALVVVRGPGYKEDLKALVPFINQRMPYMIAVDGGADAIIEAGFLPDMIVGDMDSVSDYALLAGAELVVHAYDTGFAPGYSRIEALQLKARQLRCYGTSEDMALLIADKMGASKIVTVGSHTYMIDFLEKGRKGMASTWLVRMKLGQKLIDTKGYHLLQPIQPTESILSVSEPCFSAQRLALETTIRQGSP